MCGAVARGVTWIGRRRSRVWLLLVAVAVAVAEAGPVGRPAAGSAPVIVGYVYPRDGPVTLDANAAAKLTHLNFAFADVRAGRLSPAAPEAAASLAALVGARARNRGLRVLVSAGGWTGSRGFSDLALTPARRRAFASSVVEFLRRNDLDGFDLDWEYPGLPGNGNPHRPADRANFTALLAELRRALDEDGSARGRHLLLTIAAATSAEYLAHTDMASAQASLDLVNLMAYDFLLAESGDHAGHHANLRAPAGNPDASSVEKAVKAFLAAGVPAGKLVLGVPFYGRAWAGVTGLPDLGRKGRSGGRPFRRQLRRPRAFAGARRVGPGLGRGRAGALPAEQATPTVRQLRRPRVAPAEVPLRPRSRPRGDHVLGVPRRPDGRAAGRPCERPARLETVRPRGTAVALAVLLALAATAPGGGAEPATPIPLSGSWRFELDRGDEGLVAGWGEGRQLSGAIILPGALQAQGFGDEITVDTPWTGQIVDRSFFTQPRYAPYRLPGRVKVPFWLQPDRHYVGPAWYQRDVTIPEEWRERRVVLHLERPHWQTIAWLDGRILGSNDSLSTPHEYDLGPGLAAGPHVLTIRVDNRLVVDVGINSHSVTDHTQGNWNGIVGALELRTTGEPWIDDLQVYPDLTARSAIVRGTVASRRGTPVGARLRLSAAPLAGAGTSGAAQRALRRPPTWTWRPGGKAFEARLELGASAAAWDEFTPALFRLTATLDAAGSRDEREVVFGLREIATRGTQFTINGRPIFLRGTLECAIFPLTGYPPTDVESWKRIVGIAKAHGLNHIRFHSWCPPEAAFDAADELGFYFPGRDRRRGRTRRRDRRRAPLDEWLYARGRAHPQGLRQPPVVPADGLRQRAGRERPRVPRPLGRALRKEHDPRRALHRRVRLAAARRRTSIHVHARPARSRPGARGSTRGSTPSRRRRRTDYRDYVQRARGARGQPRDRPVVRRTPTSTRSRSTRATSSRRTSRSSATRSRPTAWPTRPTIS